MDYTSIPRSLFYKEKKDLSLFSRNCSDDSLEYQYFKRLKQQPFIVHSEEAHEYVLHILNNACYICALIYYIDQPSLFFSRYLKIATNCYDKGYTVYYPGETNEKIKAATMALVYNLLNTKWFKEEKKHHDRSVDVVDETMVNIMSYYMASLEVNTWMKEIFLSLVLEKDLYTPNMEKDDLTCRLIDEAVVDQDVSINDIISGIDYICDAARLDGEEEHECSVLSNTLHRLENEVEEFINATGDINLLLGAQNKVRSRLNELGYLSSEEVKKDSAAPIIIQNLQNLNYANTNNDQELEQLRKECELWKEKYEGVIRNVQEKAFNAQTENPCFTSKQMGILMHAIALISETPSPGKTTIGEVVERISGYKAKTVNQNMKGAFRDTDKKIVAAAIESKFPNLAAKVRKL